MMTKDEYIVNKVTWSSEPKTIERYWELLKESGTDLDKAYKRWDKEYSFYTKFQQSKNGWDNPKQESFALKVYDWIDYFIKDLDNLVISFPSESEILYQWDGHELLVGKGMCFNGDCQIPNPAVLIDKLFQIYENKKDHVQS